MTLRITDSAIESDLRVLEVITPFGAANPASPGHLAAQACYLARRPGLEQRRVPAGLRFLERIVEQERPDLIEVTCPFLAAWLAGFANRRHQAPMIWHDRGALGRLIAAEAGPATWWRRGLAQGLDRYLGWVAARFQLIVVGSDFTRSLLASVGVDHVITVDPGIDLDTFHPMRRRLAADTRAEYELPDQSLALYAGPLTAGQRLDVVLDAWPEIERRARVRLAVAGAGPLEPRLKRHRYASRVHWMEFPADPERRADLLAAADFSVAPGPLEASPQAVLEALACGTPVLSVDDGAGAELVGRAQAGERYRDGDPGHCAEAAVWLAKQNLRFLSDRARRHAAAYHGWDRVLDQLFAAYRGLIDGPEAGRSSPPRPAAIKTRPVHTAAASWSKIFVQPTV